jgi:hypothetical protein
LTRLALNIAPVEFDKNVEITVEVFSYTGKVQLRTLRRKHLATHLMRRGQGGTSVICVPIVEDAPDLGFEKRKIKLGDDLGLIANLIENSLLSHFHQLGRTIIGFNPVKFIAKGTNHNLLAQPKGSSIEIPEWLSAYPCFEFQVRKSFLKGQTSGIGLTLNVKSRLQIKANCKEL